MIYNYSENVLYAEGKRPIKLKEKEGRLLMILSDNMMHSLKEINNYVYKNDYYYKEEKYKRIYILVCRLNKRIKRFLKVKNKIKYGYYYIEEKIYLTDSKEKGKQ